MSPLPEPRAEAEKCPHCGVVLAEPRPSLCHNYGAGLQQRPVWLTVVSALVAAGLILVALGLGRLGACVAIFVASEGTWFSGDSWWMWGALFGALLCVVGAVAILVWLLKKPKAKP